jgi:hypothetical protein
MIAADTPPAIYCPAPLPSRSVMVWGDDGAMETMRSQFESKGWQWATMQLGGQTNALTLTPPANLDDRAICVLMDKINHGEFGKLTAGFAMFGAF